MAFSGALTLTDLNDFITPSQACIKPVEQTNAPKSQEKEPGAASTEIVIDSSGAYYEVVSGEGELSSHNGQTKRLPQAQISLNDCLACSGCITSAESVLITLQSHTEVLDFLKENKTAANPKIPVISIAPQSLASLAAAIASSAKVTPLQVLRRLRPFLKSTVGFSHVFDTTFARHLALKEHLTEYLERKAKGTPASSIISSNRGDKGVGQQGAGNGTGQGLKNSEECQLPMLASACPGWICYAEKAHSEMLPFIARTKSPQQVMGTLVKEWMGRKWARTPDGVYHVTVMPCYDKKLEASRQDFYNDIYSTRDVDCVITTGELELIMMEYGWDLGKGVPGELEVRPAVYDFGDDDDAEVRLPELIQHTGTSSGSYLHSIMLHLQHISIVPLTLFVKMIRNSDYEEYTLTEDGGAGRVVFKGAKCFGFRNLQNIVRKVGKARGIRTGSGAAGKLGGRRRIKEVGSEDRGKDYDYVEVMACPGGCVNGGGQLKPRLEKAMTNRKDEEGYERNWEEVGVMQNAKWGDKEWTRLVDEAYWSTNLLETAEADTLADRLMEEFCIERQPKLRTSYRAVESEVLGLAVKW